MKTKCALIVLALLLVAGRVEAYSGASLDVSAEPTMVCPCDILSSDEIHATLTNNGDAADTYRLSLSLPQAWSGFIVPQITLGSGESADIDPVWLTPSCGLAPGKYTITVAARSETTGKTYEKELVFEVLRCHDVAISSGSTAATCEGQKTAIPVVISNPGKIDESYVISATPSWATVSQEKVSVSAGRNRTIYINATPPAGFVGSREIVVTAASESSYAKTEKKITLNVEACYVFNASINPAANTVCVGSPAEYQLNIDNTGTKQDTYSIVAPSWIEPDDEKVTVDSGGRKTVRLTATPLSRGESQVTVSVSSVNKAGATAVAAAKVSAADCRSVAVSVSPEERTICRGDAASFLVRVENTGTATTSYNLEAGAGNLSKQKLVLQPGEKANVLLDVQETAKAGLHTISVIAYGDNVSGEDSVALNIENCYDAGFTATPMETSACMGDVLEHIISVKNTGQYKEKYTLEYGGKKQELELSPGESYSAKSVAAADYSWGTDNVKTFVLRSSHGVHIERQAVITVAEKDKCYSVILGMSNGNVTGKQAAIQVCNAVTVPLKITNTGLREDDFRIVVDGPDWVYTSSDKISLAPLQSEDLYIYISPPYGTPEKKYDISVLAESGSSTSGIDMTADVVSKPGNATGNVTGGFTGFLVAIEDAPLQAMSIALLAAAVVAIVVVRFFVFR